MDADTVCQSVLNHTSNSCLTYYGSYWVLHVIRQMVLPWQRYLT